MSEGRNVISRMTQQTTKLPQKNLQKTGQRVDLPLRDTQKDWGAPKVARRAAKTIRRRAVTHTRDMSTVHRRAVTPLVKSITQEIAIRVVNTKEKEAAREARVEKDVAKEATIANNSLQCHKTPRVTKPVVPCGTYHAAVTNIADWSTEYLLTPGMSARRSKRANGVLSCGPPADAIATTGEQKTDDVAGRDVKTCYLTTTTTSGTDINIISNTNIINCTIIIIVVSNGTTTITALIASPIAAVPSCTYYLRRDRPWRRFSSPRGRPQRQGF